MLEVLILFKIFFNVSGYIVYDSGLTTQFSTGTFFNGGDEKTEVIRFSGEFAAIPQVFLTAELWDLKFDGVDYYVQTQNIATSSFEVYMKCVSGQVQKLRYRWYAIDGQFVEVFNQFNVVGGSSKTFPHFYRYDSKAFISILSAGFSGLFEFSVDITSLTPTDVSTSISSATNLYTISYQIIVASSTVYTWAGVRVIPFLLRKQLARFNQNLIRFLQSIKIIQNDKIQLITFIITYTQNPLTLTYSGFGGSVYLTNAQEFVFLTFTLTNEPLFCAHFEVVEELNPPSQFSTSLKMFILETNQQFTSIGTYQMMLHRISQEINFEITVNCLLNQKIYSQFYIYMSQTKSIQQNSYINDCSSQYCILTFYPRFIYPINDPQEELLIVITANSLTLSQVIFQVNVASIQQLVSITVN